MSTPAIAVPVVTTRHRGPLREFWGYFSANHGAVVIETVFAWPGMGRMAISAVAGRDYPVIIGFALVVAVLVLASNLVADLLYTLADPRVSLR